MPGTVMPFFDADKPTITVFRLPNLNYRGSKFEVIDDLVPMDGFTFYVQLAGWTCPAKEIPMAT